MEVKKGKYKHYKGKFYEVIDIVLHTETREKMILYKALYNVDDLDKEFGKEPLFVRPKTMFLENVTINGKEIPRFKFIE
jgi:hypothetical protein